jgi:hypothetical protein
VKTKKLVLGNQNRNMILKIIGCIIFFSFHSFAQEKEVIWENSLDPNIPYTVTIYGTNQGLIQNQIDDIEVKEANSFLMSTGNGIVEFNGLNFKNILKYKKYRDGTFRKLAFCKKRNSLFAIDNVNMLYEILPRFQQINLNSESVYATTLSGDSLISVCESGNIYVTHVLTKKSELIHKLKVAKPLKNIQYKNSMVFQFPFLYIITKKGVLKLNVLNRQEAIVLKNECTRLEVNPFNNNIYALNFHRLFKITPSVYEVKINGELILEDITFKNKTSFYMATPKGLIYFNSGQQFLYNDLNVLPTNRFHSCYYDTVFSNLYLGSIDKGLLKLTFKNMNTLYNGSNMNESSVASIIKTKSGTMLFAQIVNNIVQIENGKTKLFKNMRLNISSLATYNNLVYVGSWGKGLIVLNDTTEIANIKFPSLLSNDVHAVFKDSKNRFWVGNEKGVSRGNDISALHPFASSKINSQITCIYELKNGSVCLGGNDGMYIIQNDKISRITSQNSNVFFKRIRAFYEDAQGKIWIGSYGGGLYCYDNKRLISINAIRNVKLPDDIFTLCKDDFGYFYMSSNNGLWRVSEKKLNEILEGKINFLIPFHYTRVNGLLNNEFNGGFQNNFLKNGNELYFPSVEGLVKANSESIKPNPPIVKIEEISANDSIVDTNIKTFQRKENSITIKVACSIVESKHNIFFQYRLLKNGSENWSLPTKENVFNFRMLPPDDYTFVVRAIDGQNMESPFETTFTFEILPYFYETRWFQILVVLSFILITYFVISTIKNNRLHKETLNKEIAQLELNEIQAQMNPHFIFNAMNSISYYLKINENKLAQGYLNHLSRLLRKFMDYSNNDYIDIDSEVKLLTSYVEIERMRFTDKFIFEVNLPEELKNYLFPTYILQPLIENSIKHGIIPSDENHKICLSFKQEENELIVTIDDDGIGRVLAAKNKPKNHQSKGINLIQKKIVLLKERFDVNVSFEIIDKECGTLVIIKLPIML